MDISNTVRSSGQWKLIRSDFTSTPYLDLAVTDAVTITLPSDPVTGCEIRVVDLNDHAETHNITIFGNGNLIKYSTNYVINVNSADYIFVYSGVQWEISGLPIGYLEKSGGVMEGDLLLDNCSLVAEPTTNATPNFSFFTGQHAGWGNDGSGMFFGIYGETTMVVDASSVKFPKQAVVGESIIQRYPTGRIEHGYSTSHVNSVIDGASTVDELKSVLISLLTT